LVRASSASQKFFYSSSIVVSSVLRASSRPYDSSHIFSSVSPCLSSTYYVFNIGRPILCLGREIAITMHNWHRRRVPPRDHLLCSLCLGNIY
jgi:hypothetical protein